MDGIRRFMDRELEQQLCDSYLMSPDEEGYSARTERLAKLYKIRSDEVIAEKELELKRMQAKKELELKAKQADDANTQSRARLILDSVAIGLPLMVYLVGMYYGFRFEETGTITSNTLRNHIQKFRLIK